MYKRQLLDAANTGTYGNPEITKVNIGVKNRPGILISGHDLKDMEELLRQTEGTGIDVYTCLLYTSFLAALIGASLPLTGYYLWIRRLVRKSGRKVNVQLKKAA